jgi:hypothetical protein
MSITTVAKQGIATSNSSDTPGHTSTIVKIQPDDGGREITATSYQRRYVSIGERVSFTVTTGPQGETYTLD